MKRKNLYTAIILIIAFITGAIAVYFMPQKNINMVYMADSKYLPYVMVSLHSAIKHKQEDSLYNVYVIAKDFTSQDNTKIQKMQQEDVNITIVPAKNLNIQTVNLGRFASFAITLQKLFIADYLKEVDKVLYLDADTLVQKDLTEVYNTNISREYAAAVKDGLMYQFPQHIKEIDMEDKSFYFNSGIMLLNLDKIRQDNVMTKSVTYLNTHHEVFGDQDILNVVFSGKVKPLSYQYNCNSTFFEEKSAEFLSDFYQENVPQNPRQVYDNATILHFAGHKPWTDWFTHSYLKPLWQQYNQEANIKYQITF